MRGRDVIDIKDFKVPRFPVRRVGLVAIVAFVAILARTGAYTVDPEEVGAAIRAAFDAGEPYLLDFVIDGTI